MSSSSHGAGAGGQDTQVPEPPFAERARTLVHTARTGTLSSHSRRAPGYPFGSVAPYGVDASGRPTLLISTMAMHTQNLLSDPRASLLVQQRGAEDDPLALGRVTLLGDAVRVPEDEVGAVRPDYLVRHPDAQHWVDFGDFAFYRLDVREVYFVGGFGAMGWIDPADYRNAEADPLADSESGILEHMNADHADALRLYCSAFAGLDADEATMTSVDRMGFRVRARIGTDLRGVRINFPREARTPNDARVVLVEMVRAARSRTAAPSASS
jgi:putative heme iron utilization protein